MRAEGLCPHIVKQVTLLDEAVSSLLGAGEPRPLLGSWPDWLLTAQEVMYQPLGLECGHRFCADCVFTCVGKGRALGTVKAILDHVPADAACPECRTPGQALPQAARLTSLIVPQHLSRFATTDSCALCLSVTADSQEIHGICRRLLLLWLRMHMVFRALLDAQESLSLPSS